MGFFGKLIGRRKDFATLMTETQSELFKLYGVLNPSDAQKMKASVYICLAGISIVNDIGDPRLSGLIDRLVEETKEFAKAFRMRVGELANDRDEMEEILADFPPELEVNGSTTVNGLAAFDALYQTKVERVVNDILSHGGGPFGTPGYAAIVVADGIFGAGRSKEHFVDVSTHLLKFMEQLPSAV